MASHEPYGDDDDHEIPLHHKRPFGSGLKRKRVVFVPASSENSSSIDGSISAKPSISVSEMYLNIVLPQDTSQDSPAVRTTESTIQICEVCSLPLSAKDMSPDTERAQRRPHEASIAHQVCLEHSHPPSALDRSRMGLSVLQSQGWDPDSRKGLGSNSQGMQHPIKIKQKSDTLGIGVQVPKDLAAHKKRKVARLDAGQARNKALEDKKRHEKLRQQLYGNSEVEKYLGHG